MHDCPDCGQACDCDGEDLWHEFDSEEAMDCVHECEEFEDDDDFGEDCDDE